MLFFFISYDLASSLLTGIRMTHPVWTQHIFNTVEFKYSPKVRSLITFFKLFIYQRTTPNSYDAFIVMERYVSLVYRHKKSTAS